uniref:Uncharacterized protein n=1 Tax=Trichogramma kaykai TaxID=54128 RepID=A0ABD2WSE6_9HYME
MLLQEKVEKEVEEDAGRCRRVDKRPRVGVEEEEEGKRQKQSHRIVVGCSDGGDRASERGRESAEGGRFHALDPTEVRARTSSKRESLRAKAGEWIVDAFMWRFGGCILRIFSSEVAPPLGRLSSASWRLPQLPKLFSRYIAGHFLQEEKRRTTNHCTRIVAATPTLRCRRCCPQSQRDVVCTQLLPLSCF